MKLQCIPGIQLLAGISLAFAISAGAQTQNGAPSQPGTLPTPSHVAPANTAYKYDFIGKHFVWSNKPLRTTAGKICKTMKDRSFSETAYAINDEQDWTSCLDTQIRSIGYLRWLQNDGFKPSSRNRKKARAYLQKNYTMGPWGSYTFAQLSQAAKATTGK